MKKAIIVLAALALGLSACATAKTWQATGGSRGDGVVRLSYQFGMFEKPEVNDAAGQRVAADRCAVWGYTGAEAFGGQTQVCNSMSNSGCQQWLVTKEYQCTGTGRPGAMADIMMTPVVHGGT